MADNCLFWSHQIFFLLEIIQKFFFLPQGPHSPRRVPLQVFPGHFPGQFFSISRFFQVFIVAWFVAKCHFPGFSRLIFKQFPKHFHPSNLLIKHLLSWKKSLAQKKMSYEKTWIRNIMWSASFIMSFVRFDARKGGTPCCWIVVGGGGTLHFSVFSFWGDTIRRGNITIFNILSIIGHFQTAISPDILDLSPSFIYHNTYFNVLFKNVWVC